MKSSGIGGQAVLEGVMMRNRDRYAVAVRKPDGEISVNNWNTGSVRDRHILLRLPVVRGVVAFIESLILGIKTLTYSSSFIEENEEQSEKVEVAEVSTRKEMLENILIVALSILLAVGFFMILPFAMSKLFQSRVHSQMILTVIEAALKILLFLGYVVAISFLSDIKRTLMYHGAEHKTINCVENGLDLTVENVKKQSRFHRRCGTSFLLVVMLVSIIFFFFIQIDNLWLQMLYRVLLIPVVAGVSFELIQFVGNSDNKLVLWISKPGLWLQRLTTREPDDGMIEVAIASVEAVFDWRAYQAELQKEMARRSRRKKKAEKRKKELAKEKEEAAFADEDTETYDETGIFTGKPEETDETVWSRSGATVMEKPETENKKAVESLSNEEKTKEDQKEPETDREEAVESLPKREKKKTDRKKSEVNWEAVKEAAEEDVKEHVSEKEDIIPENNSEKPAVEVPEDNKKTEKAAKEQTRAGRKPQKTDNRTEKQCGNTEKAADAQDNTSEVRRRRSSVSPKQEKKSGGVAGILDRLPKSKKRRELEAREERYRNRAAERMRQIKEQEAKEAAHERAYQEAKKRRAERLAATQELPKLDEGRIAAPKVTIEQEADELKSLDRFFDDKKN